MTQRPFFGGGYLNLDLRALGVNARRFVRVLYRYTPSWPFFDEGQAKKVSDKPGLEIALDTRPRRPVPPIDDEATKDLIWVSIDTLLVRRILTVGRYKKIYDAIDTFARDEDQSRRKVAGQPPGSPPDTI
jgi:hypothetical protein